MSPAQPSDRPRRLGALAGCVCCALFLLCGCSAERYRKQADEEVYRIIAARQVEVFGEARPFSLDEPDKVAATVSAERPLSLADALPIAFVNNRDYQTQKESVYTDALSLTLERDRFSPIFGGGLSLEAERDSEDVSGGVSTDLTISKLLATGATITLDLATELSRFFTGDPRRAAASVISIGIIQPLLRDAGRLVTLENLTQAEREVVYQLRTFGRFQKSFAVQVASEYYRVLERRNVVDNERNNYEKLSLATRRSEALAAEGWLPPFQVDQAHQDELRARNRWVVAQEAYSGALDDFKITLGIPTDASIELDGSELDKLTAEGLAHPDIALEEAVRTALARRLDLMTDRDRVEDAHRKVNVAAKALEGGMSISLDADIGTEGDSKPLAFDVDEEGVYTLGLDLDLPLERTSERNAYRLVLINLARARRSWTLGGDRVKLQVRDAYRRLGQARESYEIQERSVELAQKRVESTTMLLEDGRAETRDLLESQSALVQAKNALVAALVDHAIARLEFFRDVGVLDVREETPFEGVAGADLRAASQPAHMEGDQ